MKIGPDLTIVLDMETLQITGNISSNSQIGLWLEAAKQIAPKTFEIIICTRQEEEIIPESSANIRIIMGAGKGYYALKNKGAENATGTYVFFGDVDCRPGPDYFVRLLQHFETSGADIVGGRTIYDGNDFATRACTVTTFGVYHGVDQLNPSECYLSHNVAIRREAFPDFFGPYTGRYGGDLYLTQTAHQRGLPLTIGQDLIIYHESSAHTLRGLLDRHLRELVPSAFSKHGAKMSGWDIVKLALRSGRNRWRRFQLHVHKFEFSRFERWRAFWLFQGYQLLNVATGLVFVVNPKLFARWNAYQFGNVETCTPVEQQPIGSPKTISV